jgi:arginine N-succinyltransferase
MFVIRHASLTDLDDLHSLAKQTFFINLPPDRDIIAHKIEQSTASFRRLLTKAPAAPTTIRSAPTADRPHAAGIKALTSNSDLFLLVLEDVEGRGVIGTSQVIARMGSPANPRVSLELGTLSRRSESLKIEWTHQTAKVARDDTGPSEIGGLILNHAFRGHKLRLGRFLSFTRFHLMGLFRSRFADRVIAEMLGPIDKEGYNPFFEKFTRHYIPRSFAEVYRFSQTSKEFVTGLLPTGAIDLSIMDPEVANAAGAVSEDTLPARKLLERLGFEDKGHIDPLDGGPHLDAVTDKISLVQATRKLKGLVAAPARSIKSPKDLIVSTLSTNAEFRAVQTQGLLTPAGKATLRPDALKLLGSGPHATIGATTL